MKKEKLTADEFDELFERGDVSEYIDYSTPLTKDNLFKMLENSKTEKIEIDITKELKKRLEEKSKIVGIQIRDLIKLLLAKDVGLI
jgi:uncharacterized protein with ATP-grasp and redox domains